MVGGTAAQERYPVVTLEGDVCPTDDLRQSTREEITSNISAILSEWARTNCGPATGWTRVAYLDMTDPAEQCPENWREYTVYSERVCGRLFIQSDWRCDGNFYSTMGKTYSSVCGRIIGYRFDDPDGYSGSRHEQPITTAYVDGVSLTYGKSTYTHLVFLWSTPRIPVQPSGESSAFR